MKMRIHCVQNMHRMPQYYRLSYDGSRASVHWSPYTYNVGRAVMRWLQLRFDFDSTGVRRAFDCLPKVIKVTVT